MMCRTLWKEPERYYASYFSQVEGSYYASDLALVDEYGYIWVVGRSDDAFNVAGHRLSTLEMESAVLECEGVFECAVIGIPDEIKGEVPLVCARLADGFEGTKEIIERINDNIIQQIGKIASPKAIIITNMLPKTVSGKIMRRLLKEIVTTGKVAGDITGLEDPSTVVEIQKIVADRLSAI
ncbi:AMP-binding enzyme [Priestia endophytica]|uniref:AMP-binding enzyme n=1 Tax=Priestia endophytica TaxID=135735 RepID=UPI002E1FA63F